MPLRFPGQYADKETNASYNYFRDFDSGLGRYVQSDPIGLESGLNTYAYVMSSPLGFVDPRGLVKGKIGGEVITVHKNDLDKWPSDPHGHIYDKNRVVDKDGNVYDKTSGKKVGQISKKGLERLRELFKRVGKGLSCIPILVWDNVRAYCETNPGDPACIFVNPPDPNDPCVGNPLCI